MTIDVWTKHFKFKNIKLEDILYSFLILMIISWIAFVIGCLVWVVG